MIIHSLVFLSLVFLSAWSKIVDYDTFLNDKRQKMLNKISEKIISREILQQKIRNKFSEWSDKFMKKYPKQQYLIRLHNFEENLNVINKHNQQNSSYQMDVNKFSDLTDQEFIQSYQMTEFNLEKKVMTAPLPPNLKQTQKSNNRLLFVQDAVDWRQHVNISPIKDQGSCAACYAFANIGAIQLQWALNYQRSMPILSEQQIVDCCKKSGYNCEGCSSGSLGSSIDYLANHGIMTSRIYPYTGKAKSIQRCGSPKNFYLRRNRPYYQINGVRNTMYYLTNHGPLSVAIDSTTWKLYKRGVYTDCPTTLKYSHAVVLVGIERDGTWIIRNSWGRGWGDDGYIRLASGNSCGLTDYVFLPLVA